MEQIRKILSNHMKWIAHSYCQFEIEFKASVTYKWFEQSVRVYITFGHAHAHTHTANKWVFLYKSMYSSISIHPGGIFSIVFYFFALLSIYPVPVFMFTVDLVKSNSSAPENISHRHNTSVQNLTPIFHYIKCSPLYVPIPVHVESVLLVQPDQFSKRNMATNCKERKK